MPHTVGTSQNSQHVRWLTGRRDETGVPSGPPEIAMPEDRPVAATNRFDDSVKFLVRRRLFLRCARYRAAALIGIGKVFKHKSLRLSTDALQLCDRQTHPRHENTV